MRFLPPILRKCNIVSSFLIVQFCVLHKKKYQSLILTIQFDDVVVNYSLSVPCIIFWYSFASVHLVTTQFNTIFFEDSTIWPFVFTSSHLIYCQIIIFFVEKVKLASERIQTYVVWKEHTPKFQTNTTQVGCQIKKNRWSKS